MSRGSFGEITAGFASTGEVLGWSGEDLEESQVPLQEAKVLLAVHALQFPLVTDSVARVSRRGASTAASATRGSGSRGPASSARTAAAPPPST